MSYKIEVLPDAPILWVTWNEDYAATEDAAPSARDMLKILDGSREPMIAVYDTRLVHSTWDELTYMSSQAGLPEINKHPRLLTRILIASDEVAIAVSQHLNTDTFGNRTLHPVATPEEALTLAHELLS